MSEDNKEAPEIATKESIIRVNNVSTSHTPLETITNTIDSNHSNLEAFNHTHKDSSVNHAETDVKKPVREHYFKKGKIKTGGRKKGVLNKKTVEVSEMRDAMLEAFKALDMGDLVNSTAKKSPAEIIKAITKLASNRIEVNHSHNVKGNVTVNFNAIKPTVQPAVIVQDTAENQQTDPPEGVSE